MTLPPFLTPHSISRHELQRLVAYQSALLQTPCFRVSLAHAARCCGHPAVSAAMAPGSPVARCAARPSPLLCRQRRLHVSPPPSPQGGSPRCHMRPSLALQWMEQSLGGRRGRGVRGRGREGAGGLNTFCAGHSGRDAGDGRAEAIELPLAWATDWAKGSAKTETGGRCLCQRGHESEPDVASRPVGRGPANAAPGGDLLRAWRTAGPARPGELVRGAARPSQRRGTQYVEERGPMWAPLPPRPTPPQLGSGPRGQEEGVQWDVRLSF